jgi:hypothetical protein
MLSFSGMAWSIMTLQAKKQQQQQQQQRRRRRQQRSKQL